MQQNYLFGKKALFEAINNKQKITIVKLINNHQDVIKICQSKHINYEIVNKSFFEQFKKVNHQNIICYLANQINFIPENEIFKYDLKTILILDSIQNPQNFGAIIRSALAFNVDLIVFKEKNQCQINDLVIKSSMGAINYIKFLKVKNINYFIDWLKNNQYWIYGTGLCKNAISLQKVKFDSKIAIVIGNEEYGVAKLTLEKCDFIINIEMNNIINSLNASCAAAIVLYYASLRL